jgi:hypothetical protein
MEVNDPYAVTIAAEHGADGLTYTIVLLRDDQIDRIARRVVELLREEAK